MRAEKMELPVPVVAGTDGAARPVRDLSQKTLQISGVFVATLEVQGTVNGSDWVALATVSAPAMLDITQSVDQMRVRTTAYTSGAPAAVVAGFHTRTE